MVSKRFLLVKIMEKVRGAIKDRETETAVMALVMVAIMVVKIEMVVEMVKMVEIKIILKSQGKIKLLMKKPELNLKKLCNKKVFLK